MSKSKKKRDLYAEITRVEELFGKMCNDGGDESTEAVEATLDLISRLRSIGQDEKALELLDWIEEKVIQPALEEMAQEQDEAETHVILDVNLGYEVEKNLTHLQYLKLAIDAIKAKEHKTLGSQCKVKLVSYE